MKLAVLLTHLFTGALMVALPNLSRPGLLFAVPVPPGFRDGPAGRQALGLFRAVTLTFVLIGTVAYLTVPDASWNLAAGILPGVTLAGAAGAYYWQHRRISAFAIQNVEKAKEPRSTARDPLPGYAWLAIGPYLILAGAAAILASNWDAIPVRFPVHWGLDGPDRWSERTFRGVFGPLIFAGALCGWMTAMALSTWYGARRPSLRSVMLGCGIAIAYMLAVLFAVIALGPLWGLPFWAIVVIPLVFLIPVVYVSVRASNQPDDSGVEPTPNECWKAGVIYYNPADAAVFVEKREGTGYTLNFARGWSWFILGTFLFIMAALPLLVR